MASPLSRAKAVTAGDVLDGHTLLQIDCVDRVYLTLSVPGLVAGGQVVSFLTAHEKNPIPSPALLDRRGQAFRRAVASYAEASDIPVPSSPASGTGAVPACWPGAGGRSGRSTG
jgi:hypothetical protein